MYPTNVGQLSKFKGSAEPKNLLNFLCILSLLPGLHLHGYCFPAHSLSVRLVLPLQVVELSSCCHCRHYNTGRFRLSSVWGFCLGLPLRGRIFAIGRQRVDMGVCAGYNVSICPWSL